jgi:hypothetical protein
VHVRVNDVTLWPTEHPQLVDAVVTGNKVDSFLMKGRPDDEREYGRAIIIEDLLDTSGVLFHVSLFLCCAQFKRSFLPVALWAVAAIE